MGSLQNNMIAAGTLSAYELQAAQDLQEWFSILPSFPHDTIDTLPPALVSNLESMYESVNYPKVKGYVRGALIAAGEMEYSEPVYFVEARGDAKKEIGPDEEVNLQEAAFHLYPNPAGDYIILELETREINPPTHYEIINSIGQVVKSETLAGTSGKELISIDFPDGVYHATLSFENGYREGKSFVVGGAK